MYNVYAYIYIYTHSCACVCVCLDAVLTIYDHLLCVFALSGGWDGYSKQLIIVAVQEVVRHSTKGCQHCSKK